jgi:hypothetical protein
MDCVGKLDIQHIRAKEKKVFNVLNNIPLVSQLYGTARCASYAIAGDKKEARRSLYFDMTNINLLVAAKNTAQQAKYAFHNQENGVWLGKRYAYNGLKFTPENEYFDWALMINGVIYHIKGTKINLYIEISSDPESDLRKSFVWKRIASRVSIIRTEAELYDYAKDIQNTREYADSPSVDTNEINAELFVTEMLSFACNIFLDIAYVELFGNKQI